MNLNALIGVSKRVLEDLLPDVNPTSIDISVRTARYYITEKLVQKGRLEGRETYYDVDHVKQLVMVKLLQCKGFSIEGIKAKAHSLSKDLDDILVGYGIDPKAVEEMCSTNNETVEVKEPENQEEAMLIDVAQTPSVIAYESNPNTVRVEITTPDEYNTVQSGLRLGAAFVFADALMGDGAAKLHALLYGQKGGGGSVKRAVMPVATKLMVPGATIHPAAWGANQVAIAIPDKDIYKEGSDVARVFVFNPDAANTGARAKVLLDGIALDEQQIKMDENGCALFRVPTLVCGTYSIEIVGGSCSPNWRASTSFEAARYELAPFTVTLDSVKKNNEYLTIILNAEAFSLPFSGDVSLELVENGTTIIDKSTNPCHNGTIVGALAPKEATGSLSVRVTNLKKATLVASVPLPGSKKSERDETDISSLGQVTSISLMPTEGAFKETGIYFHKGAMTNSPILLKSCVARVVELKFEEDVFDAYVIVRNMTTGAAAVKELGNVKKGQVKKVPVTAKLSIINVGAFVKNGDEAYYPFEGHAVIVRPSTKGVSVEAPARINPGQDLKVNIKAFKGASVLLKVTDKRLRVQYDPIVRAAAIIKQAVSEVLLGRATGRVLGAAPIYVPPPALHDYRHGVLRGMGGGLYASSNLFGSSLSAAPASTPTYRCSTKRALSHSPSRGPSLKHMMSPQGIHDITFTGGMVNMSTTGGIPAGVNMSAPADGLSADCWTSLSPVDEMATMRSNRTHELDSLHGLELETKMVNACYLSTPEGASTLAAAMHGLESEVKTCGPILKNAKPKMPMVRVREVEADVIYCELIKGFETANKTVTIPVPDVIGNYDVKVFSVATGDWSEAEASVRVEKDSYLEPMIPVAAHPEDGVMCEAVAVRPPEGAKFTLKVNGAGVMVAIDFTKLSNGNIGLRWPAIPGVHELSMGTGCKDPYSLGEVLDVVRRIVEKPGEETVIAQEMRILRQGESCEADAEGALTMRVMPGMEGEVGQAVQVVTEFGHYCCEQSAAIITGAVLSLYLGDEKSASKAHETIVKGEARMRSMHIPGRGFRTYPESGDSITTNWSATAARRLEHFGPLLEKNIPDDVRKAVQGLIEMGKDASKAHAGKDRVPSPMEDAYYSKDAEKVVSIDVAALKATLTGHNYYAPKSEAAFAAAVLLRSGKTAEGIDLANAVAKSMGGTMGGGHHGSYEALAYMHMVCELQTCGVVSGAGGGKVRIDDKEMTVKKAVSYGEATRVEAVEGSVAIKITKIERLDMSTKRSGLGMTIELRNEENEKVDETPGEATHGDGSRWDEIFLSSIPKAGSKVTLSVSLTEGYKDGDVMCVVLPDGLSRIVGGAKVKKFQMDFAGKDKLEVDLVCHGATEKPQTWAAVVRNMYDASRIGCVGLMRTHVS